MSTISGFGTMFYGWQHAEDGTAEVTQWAVALFLPVFPIKSLRIKMLNDPDAEPVVSVGSVLIAASPHKELQDSYQVIERLPLRRDSVLRTLARAYLLLPLLLFAPLPLILLLGWALQSWKSTDWFLYLMGILLCSWAGYFFAAIATVIHRARGGRK